MRRAPSCPRSHRTARSTAGGIHVSVLVTALTTCVLAGPLGGQAASAVGSAIATTCAGNLPDPRTQAVVAGTVTDSVSGVGLSKVEVRLAWQQDTALVSADAITDAAGFFAFCSVPAGIDVTLVASQRVFSNPLTFSVEPGMLYVQPVLLALSDPENPGVLVGRVIDSTTRRPIAGADVRLTEQDVRTITNGHGYFTFGKQPWGVYTLEVSILGYGTRTAPVRVEGDFTETVEIELSEEAVELAGLTVSVQPRRGRMDIDGLVRRMSVGLGTFLTRDMIERHPTDHATELLREVSGVHVNTRGFTTTLEVRGEPCTPDVFVDGIPQLWVPEDGLDLYLSTDLEAVEVYKGWAEIPGEYVRPGRIRPCLAIALWTRGVRR